MERRARSEAASRPAAWSVFLMVIAAMAFDAQIAVACPFCGKGSAADSAVSTIAVLGVAFLVIRALRRRL